MNVELKKGIGRTHAYNPRLRDTNPMKKISAPELFFGGGRYGRCIGG